MIVICTKCQAKFRVADEKIGPRGAKVRCSRCQTVFLVHPELGTLPVADGAAPAKTGSLALELSSGAVRAPKREISTSAGLPPPRNAATGVPNAAVRPPAHDRFADADPFAAPPAATDPFAAAPPPAADPFAAPAGDPFGAAGAPASDFGDPFAASTASRSTLPVTDLSDPHGGRAGPLHAAAASGRAAGAGGRSLRDRGRRRPRPGGRRAARPGAGSLRRGPVRVGGPLRGRGATSGRAARRRDAARGRRRARARGSPHASSAGGRGPCRCAARDRPRDRRARRPGPVGHPFVLETGEHAAPSAAPDPFAGFSVAASAGAGEPYDPGAFDFGADGGSLEPGPAAGAEVHPAPAAPSPGAQAVPEPRGASAAAGPASPAAVPPPALGAVPQVPERIPGARTSRLRAVAVNAVALVALLVVALAIWAVWRTDGPFEASALRPSAILAALGRSGAAAGPWSAQEVRSGVYERARGAPLLFVRGRVVSRAPAPVRAVRVAVAVMRGGLVLARGEVLAGAVPTAEELYGAADEKALAAVATAASARAPAEVRPGDSVPFLVAVGDAPPDLEGASLRIDVAPAGGGAP